MPDIEGHCQIIMFVYKYIKQLLSNIWVCLQVAMIVFKYIKQLIPDIEGSGQIDAIVQNIFSSYCLILEDLVKSLRSYKSILDSYFPI